MTFGLTHSSSGKGKRIMADLMALYRLAYENGITVDCFPLRTREALSVMDTDGTCYIAIDPTKLRSSSDETAKLAHELGHCCTGSFYNQWAICDVRRKHENRADKWAIEHLVPRAEFQEAVSAGLSDLWSLSEYFCVSEEFMKKAVCWYAHGNLDTKTYFG